MRDKLADNQIIPYRYAPVESTLKLSTFNAVAALLDTKSVRGAMDPGGSEPKWAKPIAQYFKENANTPSVLR